MSPISLGRLTLLAVLPAAHCWLASTTATRALPAVQRSSGVRAALSGPELGSFLQLADAEPAVRMTAEAVKAASGELGWWDTYIKTVEDGIFTVHDFLAGMGVPGAYGLSIFLFVLAVKIVTLPLNWKQLATSAGMKSMKPQQEIVKKWYGDNTDLLNVETGALFEKFDVNPLAGCLPSLAQIPVFLGVYYSVTSIAKAQVYSEGFLWLPSLSGPIADRSQGLSWLTENWANGAPPLGWHDTLCYLTIPAILVCTQTAALYLLGSFEALEESGDKNSQTTGYVLRLLPFMLGWFAMNAPAGLGVYWIFNNILTTATTVAVKKLVEKPPVEIPVDLVVLGPRREMQSIAPLGVVPDWITGIKDEVEKRKAAEAAVAGLPQEAAAADQPAESSTA